MTHYKGQCYAWDVVNEAFNEDGTYRESVFSTVLGGDEFIELAFKTASELDPKAKLYYNDYNLESPSAKTEAVRKLVRQLQSKKIRIDGVGLQAHLTAESRPTLDEHIAAIEGFAELGVEVALTELDVRLAMPANATNLAQQKEAYKNVSQLVSECFTEHLLIVSLKNTRPSELVSKLRDASVSPSGISTTPSAGSLPSFPVRVPPFFGSMTLAGTLLTRVSWRL